MSINRNSDKITILVDQINKFENINKDDAKKYKTLVIDLDYYDYDDIDDLFSNPEIFDREHITTNLYMKLKNIVEKMINIEDCTIKVAIKEIKPIISNMNKLKTLKLDYSYINMPELFQALQTKKIDQLTIFGNAYEDGRSEIFNTTFLDDSRHILNFLKRYDIVKINLLKEIDNSIEDSYSINLNDTQGEPSNTITLNLSEENEEMYFEVTRELDMFKPDNTYDSDKKDEMIDKYNEQVQNMKNKYSNYKIDGKQKLEFFDIIEAETKEDTVSNFINEDSNNIVIQYEINGKIYIRGINREELFPSSDRNEYIILPCLDAIDSEEIEEKFRWNDGYLTPEYAYETIELYNFRKIGIIPEPNYTNIDEIMNNKNKQVFILANLEISFPSFTSKNAVKETKIIPMVSELHCQSGYEKNISYAIPIDIEIESNTRLSGGKKYPTKRKRNHKKSEKINKRNRKTKKVNKRKLNTRKLNKNKNKNSKRKTIRRK